MGPVGAGQPQLRRPRPIRVRWVDGPGLVRMMHGMSVWDVKTSARTRSRTFRGASDVGRRAVVLVLGLAGKAL